MLEGLAAGLLNRFLGMYVQNFDPTQLKVGIWSGDVKLRNLELRREALDQLKLPINVVEGHLGQLTLIIPWSNLRGAPVKVFVEDVFLLASPKEEAEYDQKEEEQRSQRLKMEKLDSAELLKEKNREGMSPEEQQKNQSFTQSLVTKIVDNLQITVKKIHIRYEDSISAPGHPFALGLTLEEFSAVSTDGDWKPTFIQNSTVITNKLATLGALAVYWNTDTHLMGSGREAALPPDEAMSHEDMVTKFRSLIDTTASSDHQFILKPVSGQAKIELNKSGDVVAPKFKVNLLFEEIGLVLDDHQYRDALMMADLFHYFIRHQEYRALKPKGVRPSQDPRAWFRFAGKAVLGNIHERNRKWSWDYFRERRDDRIRYIELFKKKKEQQQLSPDEEEDIVTLEWKLGYEDLRFWRSLARNQLKKENAEALKRRAQQPEQQGWMSWIWGSKPQGKIEKNEENTQMTEEQRKELYDMIDWDEKTALAEAIDVPREAVKLCIEACLGTGSFTLRQGSHGKAPRDLLGLYFDVFKAKALQRKDSMLANVSLGGLRVEDGTTPDSLYPEIVRVKDAPGTKQRKRLSLAELEKSSDEPFFQFEVEQNPIEREGDIAVMGSLKPLEVVWNPNFVVGIVDFFRPPERHMESITALMETAGATVEGIREQTRAGLEFALEEHKTINAELSLQAPLIIVPVSITAGESTCVIVDAGHIHVNSQLVDQETMKEIQAKQRQTYSEEDFKRLESVMYDKFIVKLTSTQVLIGPSIEKTKAQLTRRSEGSQLHVVEKINVDFVVETSILPKAPNLTKFRVSGHMPMLHASVSDSKYKNLMKIIDVAIPKLGGESRQDEVPALKADEGGHPRVAPPQEQTRQPSRPRLASSGSNRSPGRRSQRENRQSAGFPFLQPPSAVVLDDMDDDQDDFEDASDGADGEQLKIQQRSFEFNFKVDTLKGSLYRSDPDRTKPDALLVELVAERFDLAFYTRLYDMSAEVSLGAVSVDDFVDNPPAEFKSIVSSGDSDDLQEGRSLVHVKYMDVKPQSPEFMPVYEGVKTNISASVLTINLVVTRKTLLTLLDFILVTFAGGNNDQEQSRTAVTDGQGAGHEETATEPAKQNADSGSIRVKVDLKGIRLILNNDGIRLATLSLTEADAGIFLRGNTMRIFAKLGDLSLVDDVNLGVSRDSNLRRLVTIQGDELADFRYETFDADNKQAYPGHDSAIFLRAGSVKVNFVEEPFRKIIDFLVKFGRMQALYNAARQAAVTRANQMQQSPSRFKFDVVIKTPIVVFPRLMVSESPERDVVTAYLGEIYAQNEFAPLDDGEASRIAMKISTGIRKIRLTSDFNYDNDRSEELEMIDQVDLGLSITYAEHKHGVMRPDTEIEASMSDIKLRLTQHQLKFLLEISKAVPAAFAGDGSTGDEDAAQLVDEETLRRARTASADHGIGPDQHAVDLGPELKSPTDTWTQLDLVFRVDTIGLELIMAPLDEPVGDLAASSLSRFSLDETKVKTRMMSDGSLEAELLIRSLTIYDSRPKGVNKFRRIMSSSNKESQQLMASVTMSGGKESSMIAMATIDSPRVIFALDYLFALQAFATEGLKVEDSSPLDDVSTDESPEGSEDADSLRVSSTKPGPSQATSPRRSESSSGEPQKRQGEASMSLALRVNLVDAQVILIANPLRSNSEAIVLGIRQVLLSQQNALTFQVSEMGMFLCVMDRFETSRLRIIDDFSIQLNMDNSQPFTASYHVDVEPLIVRLSLRDILLVLQIVAKASELSESGKEPVKETPAEQKAKQLRGASCKSKAPSGRALSTAAQTKANQAVVTKGAAATKPRGRSTHEELSATLQGMRIVLIGDLHELPIVDVGVKEFTATAENWSSNLKAEAAIHTYTNVYNFSKSSWEPLIEPWQVGLGVARDSTTGVLSVDVASAKTLDITITTATIAVASKSLDFLTTQEDVLDKPRWSDAPYRIRNHTGFVITMHSRSPSSEESIDLRLDDGEEAPWTFEEWEKMRENILTKGAAQNDVGIKLEGSGFDTVKNVRVNREGEYLYSLRPKTDNVTHRLCVDVRLGSDNVKDVTLRSPLLVENATEIPVELGIYDASEGHLLKIEKIAPGDSRPAPVGAAYEKKMIVRPDSGFGYQWSRDQLWWRDLLKRPTKQLVCTGDTGDSFYFQVHADFDKTNPLTKAYPSMKIKLSAPVTLENLLPYDFKYRIYDRNTKKDWSNFLRKGGVSPVHMVELSHLLLLSVDMQDTIFKPSDFSIINSGSNDDFRKEKRLLVRDEQGLTLHLSLHYFKVPKSGGAFKISVYSPYVVLNKTGLDMGIRAKSFLQQAKAAAGQFPVAQTGSQDRPKALPFMFSFGNDEHQNRALLKVDESEWSKPQSFDAVGSTSEVVLNSSTSKHREIHLGITVKSGDGKYKMTRVVTLAPRFVLVNKLGEEVLVRESGSSNHMTIRSGVLHPLHFMQKSAVKQLCLRFPGVDNHWTSPFNIADLGTTHVKMARAGQRQRLVRVEILTEESTIFLHMSVEGKHWPFSMRNESDTEFSFYQANPNVDEDDDEDRSGWKPVRYRLPPRSVMPYAWDFPAAKFREVVISTCGKERHVKLAEMGNQIPMKFAGPGGQQKIIDINVAADGPMQTLILSNFRASRSMFKPAAVSRTNTGPEAFEVKDQGTGATMLAQLKLSGIGVSLINAHLKELAYVTLREVQLRLSDSPLIQTMSLAVKWIQIDNQLYGGIFPIVLYPSVVPKRANEVEAHPSLHAMVSRVKDDSYGVLYIKYATVLLQQMTVDLDEDFVFALLDFSNVPGASWTAVEGPGSGRLCDEDLDIPEPSQQQSGQDMYFEVLNIQPMQIDLSFVRTERVNAEDKTSTRNPIMFFLNVMTMAIGNVNDAPVRFNALMLDNVRVSRAVLVQNVSSHYSQEVMYQIHKILGSADFLGNPVGLFNNISSGVTDIFYEPYQGLILSDRPEEFGIGIARGAVSFAKKTVYGFSDSFSKFTGSLGKGLAAASLDKQFQDRRRITRARNRPKHALYGVAAGANSLLTSVASGVGGLARKPLEGAEQEGALGFFKGVGKGVLGLATKPAVGVLDMASNVSEGIRNTTTVFDGSELERTRLPRFMANDGIVRPYGAREALGQFWLKQVDNGKYFDEQYVGHLELPREDMVVMVTYARILLIRSRRLTSEWDVKLKDVQTVAKERTGVSLTLRGGTNGPFIPVGGGSERGYLYRMIGVAAEEFNRRFRGAE
ncbi:vacuolar protein sorting-associated protein vps13 [Ophiocordyceps camponoti-floridani]|uniref:Vacuolar protein sorting-associated protein vps13 n=1 Tax=Ophiocordyceps camponoti-floridani TaxID=2030778 RepID=A0A8H4QCI6_9HYPO|nr:vacuolar protein sorting-associated protein vps13 [Ophiocordyceps camponoti-floridani]